MGVKFYDGIASAFIYDPAASWKKWYDGKSGLYLVDFEVELAIDFTGETVPLIFVDYVLNVGTFSQTYYMSKVPLPDASGYYGGFKEGRILSVGTIKRSLSDERGEYEAAGFSFTVDDKDRKFRSLLDGIYSKYLLNKFCIIRMISDEDRRQQKVPRTIALGLVRNYLPEKGLKFTFEAEDYLALFTGLGASDKQIPRRTITRGDFPTCPVEVVGRPVPIVYGNLTQTASASTASPPAIVNVAGTGAFGGQGFGLGDGGWRAGYGTLAPPCIATPPTALTLVASAGTPGALSDDVPNAEYGAIVTAVDANGVESDPFPFYTDNDNSGRGRFVSPMVWASVVADQKLTATWSGAVGAVKYRVYLGWYYYGCRWTQVIEVTAPTLTCDFTHNPAWQNFETAANTTPGSYPPPFGYSKNYAISAVFADGSETGLSPVVFGLSGPYRRPIRIDYTSVVGAVGYKVYRASPHPLPTWDMFWTLNATDTTFIDDCLGTGSQMLVKDEKKTGVIPTVYVGDRAVGGSTRKEFLVAGHAMKSIDAIYIADQKKLVTDANWLVPGTAAWTSAVGAAKYRDYNGRRYTVVYGSGQDAADAAAGTKPLTLDGTGIEDVADGSGILITDALDQYLHAMRNWVLQDYSAGDWLTGPDWPNSGTPAISVLDDASFSDASDIAKIRVVGGYLGAFIMGANGEQTSIREWVKRFNLSCDVYSGFSRKSQFRVVMLNDSISALGTAKQFTQAREIFADSFTVKDDVTRLENVIVYSHSRNWGAGTWASDDLFVEDAASVLYTGQSKKSQKVELWMMRSPALALDIANRRLTRMKEPPRIVTFETSLPGLNTDLGDYIKVTHIDGPGITGWVDRPCVVIRHEFDVDGLTVRMECLDMNRIFVGAFILGDETALAASWTTATATDKQYGYLGNEPTATFSDGAAAKRLR